MLCKSRHWMEALIEQKDTTSIVICFRYNSTPTRSVVHWMSSGNEGGTWVANQTRATSTVMCIHIHGSESLMQPNRTTLVARHQRYFRVFNRHIIYIVPAKTLMQPKRMSPLWRGLSKAVSTAICKRVALVA